MLSPSNSGFINFLRALASQLVVFGHAFALNGVVVNDFVKGLPSFSVLIFFVLSGYVISKSSFEKGQAYGLNNYLVDRFARIYISLVPALFLTAVIALLFFAWQNYWPYSVSPVSFVGNILMLHESPVRFYLPFNIGFFGDNLPLWSLSIEWWLYVAFGMLFYRKINYVLVFFAALFVIGYAIFPGRASGGLTFIWFAGVIICHLEFKSKLIYSLFFLMLTIACLLYSFHTAIIPFCCFFATFINSENKVFTKFFNLFKWPSNYSYSLYIIHYPIMLVLNKFVVTPVFNWIIPVLVVNLTAFLLYVLFESRHKKIAQYLKLLVVKSK